MTDDVEATLASLEQRLRALQDELDAEGAAPEPRRVAEPRRPAEPRRFAPRAPAPPPDPPRSPEPPRSAPPDPLDRFAAQLRALVAAWERTAAELRGDAAGEMTFRGGVAVEAQGDLAGLCALDGALRAIPGVASVTLRAYAGGAGALEVALDREVALVAELRRTLDFDLVAAGGGRLSVALR